MDWVRDDLGPGIQAEHAIVGFAAANCYILTDEGTREAAIVDPGTGDPEEVQAIADEVKRLGLTLKYILNTHGHPDHMWGNDVLKDALGGKVLIHELDGFKLTDPDRNASTLFGYSVRVRPADRLLRDDEVLELGSVALTVLHTPGHSAGGVAFLGDGYVLTGDTLFAGSIGRSDLPCSSEESTIAYEVLLESIRTRLFSLPDETVVLPGHGPVTTIGVERRTNPFLR
ncbi:MAG: MBL fold metallo-hydrolase [Candidatus Eisenbacteria bacterium]